MTRKVRRPANAPRCGTCRMHIGLCFCDRLPRLATTTRVVLVTHNREDRKASNTGRLAVACLEDAHIVVRGERATAAPELPIAEGTEPLLLFPHADAEVLAKSDRPVTLIVPDGSWRQAFKVRARVPSLRGVRAVRVPPGPPSRYRLRREFYDYGLATIEAIARALDVLEGPAVRSALEEALELMVARALWVKGDIDDVPDLPPSAERHDPRSGLA